MEDTLKMTAKPKGAEMNIDALIAAWDMILSPGQSSREPCPKCRAFEQAFVVTKQQDGSLVWVCHRASCGFKGGTSSPPRAQNKPVNLRKHAEPPIVDLCVNHTPRYNAAFGLDFDIDAASLDAAGVGQDIISNGWYFPIFDCHGSKLGFTLRWYDGRQPKCRTYLTSESQSATMAWYRHPGNNDWVVVVEDQVSAIKLWSLGYDAVALLGTYMSANRAGEISQCYRNMLVWLDPDARAIAAKYTRQFRMYFDTISWVDSKHDPKDTGSAEIRNHLRGIGIGEKTNSGLNDPECV